LQDEPQDRCDAALALELFWAATRGSAGQLVAVPLLQGLTVELLLPEKAL
jgi:hypothetical protein